jgi:phenylalanyl-tRNA synthetase beta chain
MKVSLNWIKQYVDFELPPVDELVRRIGAQLGEVEEIENIGEKYRDVHIAQVVECRPHQNSDHLNVCKIDDGGVATGVERDEQGLVQVVCGATNVRIGLMVAWLAPGVTVPESVGKDPFVLEAREIRGEKSNGMLASPRELALGDGHEGIMELDGDIKPGDDFAKAYALDDYIIDIENKMFTHRPDCFGILGVAREVAGILGHQFVSPDWYLHTLQDVLRLDGELLPLAIHNELPALVPRFVAVPLSGIEIRPSPVWLQTYLFRSGVRPINNVVDVTNYIMVLTGQPLHAYDYDKVKALSGDSSATMVVRFPKSGEKITLLNGKTIEPRPEAMMVATDTHLICVGGTMGGAETEVDKNTRNIILEAANWDMYSIRRTSMAHGLFTDAVTRFNKGQSPLQNDKVTADAVRMLRELAGAKVGGAVIDDNHVTGDHDRERRWVHPPVPVTTEFINARLGFDLRAEAIQRLLGNVECVVTGSGDNLSVEAPFWRTDIETREDVVEEVGRLYGFDKLPLQLPVRTIKPVTKDPLFELKSQVRSYLSRAGANEALTYSFVHGDLLRKVGQDPAEAFQVGNALSPDLQYYRLSLTPSLLDKVYLNSKAGYDTFALFEMGKVHGKSQLDADGLPREFERLALVYATNDKQVVKISGAPYYVARKYLEQLLRAFGMWQRCTLIPSSKADWEGHPFFSEVVRPFDVNRSAVIHDGQRILGVVGEYALTVRRALKLPLHSAGFEFGLNLLLQQEASKNEYEALPRFPKVTQDITLEVDTDLPYDTLLGFLQTELDKTAVNHLHQRLRPLDIYKRDDGTTHKRVTFRLEIASYEKTLRDAEVSRLLDSVAQAAKQRFNAERV